MIGFSTTQMINVLADKRDCMHQIKTTPNKKYECIEIKDMTELL